MRTRRRADVIGMRFGRLVVIEEAAPDGNRRRVLVRCDCGVEKAVRLEQLRRRGTPTRSCGCLKRELVAERGRRSPGRRPVHGHARSGSVGLSPTYKSWRGMVDRCYGSANGTERDRGVGVCQRWLGERPEGSRYRTGGFASFLEDMGERPEGAVLSRIDVYADYTPENCRWRSRSTNQRITDPPVPSRP